jgi:hypothetical protein
MHCRRLAATFDAIAATSTVADDIRLSLPFTYRFG